MKYKGLWISLAVILLVLLVYIASSYNRFVTLDQKINGDWSEVENQYQRQADLIPNLVSIVSSSVSVETKFVKDVIDYRTKWQSANNVLDKDAAGVQMADSMATFVSAVAENYPQLQANTQYIALIDLLEGTQNRITVARGRYIQNIQEYNIAINKFPSNVLSGIFGFSEKQYYHADATITTPQLGSGQLPQ